MHSVLLLLCFFTCGLFVSEPTEQDHSRLAGLVRDEAGAPVPGAWVFACPVNHRVGLGTSCAYLVSFPPESAGYYCPTCQADRGRRATSGEDGRFSFTGLDAAFHHFAVIGKTGYRPVLADREALASSEPVVLAALDEERLAPERVHRGRVLLPDGTPGVGATVRCVGVDTPEGRLWMKRRADYMAVADEKGAFLLTTDEDSLDLWVRVRAAGAARTIRHLLHAEGPHEIHLEAGASVSGAVLDPLRPVDGIRIGLVQVERAPHRFHGEYTPTTDEEGRFRFENVAQGEIYHLYGAMGESEDEAVIPAKRLEIEYGGDRVQVGFLLPKRGHQLSGLVLVGESGVPVPGSQILVMRRNAWDARPFPIAEDGRFLLEGLPAEPLWLSVYAPGYRVSRRNPSRAIDDCFGRRLAGVVTEDRAGLELHLVPLESDPLSLPGLPPGDPATMPFRSAVLENQ